MAKICLVLRDIIKNFFFQVIYSVFTTSFLNTPKLHCKGSVLLLVLLSLNRHIHYINMCMVSA